MNETRRRLESVAAAHPGLALLVLHGSRARGDAHAGSDWDFAFLADGDVDALQLRADLADAVGSDAIDLADLARSSALLRSRVSHDGRLLYEATPGRYDRERVPWVLAWLDMEPVVRRAHEAIMKGLIP
ncbi:MAG: nucleotidyltransferase domain-containing protein [Myxococcales bacterium]|nr:nucleotidyltransferase domain-containing protein [Myxococcales bacterium]MCB9737101.1 nucleotidyltransferase domain-containing protein [Deltaproteobacteria bacterium]